MQFHRHAKVKIVACLLFLQAQERHTAPVGADQPTFSFLNHLFSRQLQLLGRKISTVGILGGAGILILGFLGFICIWEDIEVEARKYHMKWLDHHTK